MAYPVTLNGRTYTLADFEGTNYVDGLPDAFQDFVTHAGNTYQTTSTTSIALGTGTKVFTVADSGKPYASGTPLRISNQADETDYIDALVTSYTGTTLTVNAVGYSGTGTIAAWNINIGGGPITVAGTLPISQGGTGATTAAAAATALGLGTGDTPTFAGLNVTGTANFGDVNITNVGDISLDSISPDAGTDVTMSANLLFGDSNKIMLGNSSDLQLYHDGTGSFIDEIGTGPLKIRTDSFVGIYNTTETETIATFADDGAVRLYYDNGEKLTTTSGGVSVTGTAAVDQLNINSVGAFGSFDSKATITTEAAFAGSDTDFRVKTTAGNVDHFFVQATTGNVGVGTASPSYKLHSTTSDGSDFAGYFYNTAGSGSGTSLVARGGANNTTPNFQVQDYNGNADFTVTGDGNVGIGTSSPNYALHITRPSGTATSVNLEQTGVYSWEMGMPASGAALLFKGSGTERARIDASGNWLVATATTNPGYANTNTGVSIGNNAASSFSRSGADYTITVNNNTGAPYYLIAFRALGGGVGSITSNGSSTSYNTSSDYRLKENVVADWDATTRLKQLNPVRFNFIADPDTTVDGFLAHEVQDIVPEAITGTKDAMRDEEYEVSAATGDIYTPAIDALLDEDGNEVTPAVAEVIHSTDVERPEELAEGQQWRETTAAVMGMRSVPEYQGIDQSKLTPLLTKALIEAFEKIEQLEARIAALEA